MNVRLLGHRGARAQAPENTMAGFGRALEDGAEGFEFDVRVTRDGVAVLLHDETLDRTTSGKGALSETDFADVARLDAGCRFGEEYRGERLPSLTDVLERFLGETTLALEMKETLPPAVFHELAARLEKRDGSRLIVASFLSGALGRAGEYLPAVPRALVLHRGQAVPSPRARRALGLWGLFARTESVDEAFVTRCRGAALHLFAYTVNDLDDAARLAEIGVDGIISDDPGAVAPALS